MLFEWTEYHKRIFQKFYCYVQTLCPYYSSCTSGFGSNSIEFSFRTTGILTGCLLAGLDPESVLKTMSDHFSCYCTNMIKDFGVCLRHRCHSHLISIKARNASLTVQLCRQFVPAFCMLPNFVNHQTWSMLYHLMLQRLFTKYMNTESLIWWSTAFREEVLHSYFGMVQECIFCHAWFWAAYYLSSFAILTGWNRLADIEADFFNRKQSMCTYPGLLIQAGFRLLWLWKLANNY